MMGAFDEVLAPLFTTLDCFDSYLDPKLAPHDFVDWLASWVGVDIDETWTLERRRRLIQDAVVLYRIRGTAAGLAAHVRLYAGVTPEIEESGGCDWSQTADSPLPGSPQPRSDRAPAGRRPGRRQAQPRSVASWPRPGPPMCRTSSRCSSVGPPVEGPTEEHRRPAADDQAPGAVDLPGSEHIELAPQAPPSQEALDDATNRRPDDSEPTS